MAVAPGPTAEDVDRARFAIADVVRHTPILPSATLTDNLAAEVVLKAENLQRTGAFKIRGALNKLTALGEPGCADGIVTLSSFGEAGDEQVWAEVG